jgi:hypothetical protein
VCGDKGCAHELRLPTPATGGVTKGALRPSPADFAEIGHAMRRATPIVSPSSTSPPSRQQMFHCQRYMYPQHPSHIPCTCSIYTTGLRTLDHHSHSLSQPQSLSPKLPNIPTLNTCNEGTYPPLGQDSAPPDTVSELFIQHIDTTIGHSLIFPWFWTKPNLALIYLIGMER